METYKLSVAGTTRSTFPGLRDIIIALIEDFRDSPDKPEINVDQGIQYCFQRLEQVRAAVSGYSPELLANFIVNTPVHVEGSGLELEGLITDLKTRWQASNEFFTIFDIAAGKDIHIDERVDQLLGIRPEDFDSSSMRALDPDLSIYYRDDVYHTMRFALIAYTIVSFPGLKFRSLADHYMVRFRVRTNNSSNQYLRMQPYVVVEKRCYMALDNTTTLVAGPKYHLDRYTVYTNMELDFATSGFVSSDSQTVYMNAFSYLFNAYLIGISPKYIALLHERMVLDRNKAIASSMNEKIAEHTGKPGNIDEHQVADCFAKTIRNRVAEAINTWDKRSNGKRITINSDLEAVHYAKVLGLLPIPAKVRQLIYQHIS